MVRIGQDEPFVVIGERINPTGKKELTAELQQGVFTKALDFADQQKAAGARVLDVNVGAHKVDQKKTLPELVSLLTGKYPMPLSLDSSDPEAILRALPWTPASSLINSISGDAGKLELLGPACRDFGAPLHPSAHARREASREGVRAHCHPGADPVRRRKHGHLPQAHCRGYSGPGRVLQARGCHRVSEARCLVPGKRPRHHHRPLQYLLRPGPPASS